MKDVTWHRPCMNDAIDPNVFPCIDHRWKAVGGRSCPKGSIECSQTVYECPQCGVQDYGETGGPAWEECKDCKPLEDDGR